MKEPPITRGMEYDADAELYRRTSHQRSGSDELIDRCQGRDRIEEVGVAK